ncbi:MAG: phosphoribosylglycinamide formyltransferase [Rhodospirillaceae bacterium]|nr:phosphoribosylglycinamide formyltransferase [Rhodospirillaceae bacterium]
MANFPVRPRIGFLASHNGTNMRVIVAAMRAGALDADPAVLISNNAGSTAIAWAGENNVPWVHLSAKVTGSDEAADAAIAETLKSHGADLIVLAGYMRKLGPATLKAYHRRILNVHPALLPKFGGQGMYGAFVHEAVLKAGERETGATIHIVDGEYDHGPVVMQAAVPVEPGDTAQTLAARVQAREQTLYPDVLKKIIAGEIDLDRLA